MRSARQQVVAIGLDAVGSFLRALQREFHSLAEFFYDACAPTVIFVAFRRTSFAPKPLSILHSAHARPVLVR